MLLRFEPQNLGGDVLDGVEELAVAGQQERSIGAGEFDGNLGRRDRRRRTCLLQPVLHRRGRRSRVALGRCRQGCGG